MNLKNIEKVVYFKRDAKLFDRKVNWNQCKENKESVITVIQSLGIHFSLDFQYQNAKNIYF